MLFKTIITLVATLVTWGVTALGAATVYIFKSNNKNYEKIMLGFSAGVMLAASYLSLLEPAIEKSADKFGRLGCIVISLSFLFGAVFMILAGKVIDNIKIKLSGQINKDISKSNSLFLMILSITLHNIPEGLAVGVAFGEMTSKNDINTLISASILAFGIAIQNFPEGAAISLPLHSAGHSKKFSFIIGEASAIVEPIFGLLGVLLVSYVSTILPISLAFAAGCMIYVIVNDLIPNSVTDNKNVMPTVFTVFGFSAMMFLDTFFS